MPTPTLRSIAATCAVAIAACSGSGSTTTAPAAPVVIATPPLTAGDAEVAKVNGRSVWASCVAAQAQAIDPTAPDPRAAALDQCIAFELLAQAAEARGLAAAPEVATATRAAAVNRLVALAFDARYRTPADLKEPIDVVMKRNEWRMHILELRASAFARFAVPKDAAPAVDAEAHQLAVQLAGELAGQTGLYGVHLAEAAARIAAGSHIKLESSDVKPTHKDDLVETYSAALYAIPAVGRTSPAVRTQWGWDVVLWTGGVEAKEHSRDEIVAELFPEIRRRQFQLWVTQLGKQLGVHIDIDQVLLAKLDTGEPP